MRLPKVSGAHARLTAKFAVFALVCVAILGYMAKEIGDISFFASETSYQAQLSDATGLSPHDQVKIAGVPVGSVQSVQIQHGHALVAFTVSSSHRLRASTDVGLQWRNVLGQKYLYVYPGATGPYLAPGATIPMSHEVPGGEIGQLLDDLGPVLKAVNPKEANAFVAAMLTGLQGNQAKVDDLLDQAAVLSTSLGSVDNQVGGLIDSSDKVLTSLAARNGDLKALIDHLSGLSRNLAARNSTLDTAVVDFADLAKNFSRLLEQNHGNIDAIVNNLQTVADVLSRHTADLKATMRTIGSGFAPYFEISGYGQWFQIRGVYTCLADQAQCFNQDPLAQAPPPLGPGGSSGGSPSGSASSPTGGSSGAQNQAVRSIVDLASTGRGS